MFNAYLWIAWAIHKFLNQEEQLDLVSFKTVVCVPYLKSGDAGRRMGRRSNASSLSRSLGNAQYGRKGHVIAKQ